MRMSFSTSASVFIDLYNNVCEYLNTLSFSVSDRENGLILFYKIINNLAQVPHEQILIKAYEGTRKNTFVFPNIIYCCEIWGNTIATHI